MHFILYPKFLSSFNFRQKIFFTFILFCGLWGNGNYAYAQNQIIHKIEKLEETSSSKPFYIGVSSIVEHPSFTKIVEGIKNELSKAGYHLDDNLKVIYKTAQNRIATIVQIANKFVGDKMDILIPLGTAAAQADLNATSTTPILFSGVTDPQAAGLLQNINNPKNNITGVSDLPDIKKQILLLKEIVPNAKRIGYIYNPSETNSIAILKKLKELEPEYGFQLIEAGAIQTSQVRSAVLSIIDKIDVLYLGTDNTVVSALETALNVTTTYKKPVITADIDSVHRGALATFATDYYKVGQETGKLAVKILNHTALQQIPITYAKATDLVLNLKTAEKIGYKFPQSLLDRASELVR